MDLEQWLNPFEAYTLPLRDWVEIAVDWIVVNFRGFFQAISVPVGTILDGVELILQSVPPLIFLLLLFGLALWVANWRVALFSLVSMTLIGMLGIWEDAMTTLALVITAVLFCALLGIPLGILAARSDGFETLLRPLLDAMQTTPAFVYLVPVVMLFGVGNVPGIIATIIFALPPIIRLTDLGIRGVPTDVVEAAYAFGSTPLQVLWEVQLPLALRTILAGLNQTLLLALSMVVIAAMIAAGGLGTMVLRGLGRLDVGLGVVGGLGIVLLAIILDRITQAIAGGQQAPGAPTGH
jgi:ABC-type proline/glycine betaine transport system permease subunit